MDLYSQRAVVNLLFSADNQLIDQGKTVITPAVLVDEKLLDSDKLRERLAVALTLDLARVARGETTSPHFSRPEIRSMRKKITFEDLNQAFDQLSPKMWQTLATTFATGQEEAIDLGRKWAATLAAVPHRVLNDPLPERLAGSEHQ